MRKTLPVTVITRMTVKWVFFENFLKNSLVTYLPMVQHDNKKSFSYSFVSLECCLSCIIYGHLYGCVQCVHGIPLYRCTLILVLNHHIDDHFGGFQYFAVKSFCVMNNSVYL